MSKGIGVFLCRCGSNIADALDIDALAKSCRELDGVSVVETHDFLCSAGGREFLAGQIREGRFDRLVVAACSPREHESTFRAVCEDAGLNPFLLQVANVREHCAWVTDSKDVATEKAEALVRAAVRRVIHHLPLEKREIDCVTDVLVIGGGIAGIEAALLAAGSGRKVYIVEKLPSVGGNVMKYEDVAPTLECASCMMEPRLSALGEHPNVEVLCNSTLEAVVGFYGNFVVRVKKRARYVSETDCIGCEACFEACPQEVPNEYHERLGNRKAIYQLFPGSVPGAATIDPAACLRLKGGECSACADACPFGAVQFEQEDETRELNVGAIVLATGFELADVGKLARLGYGKLDGVYTSLELETLANSNGPSEGKIVLRDGREPSSVALVHCAGSMSAEGVDYCSGVCCLGAMKLGSLVRKRLPGATVHELYSHLCLPGMEASEFRKKMAGEGTRFVRAGDMDGVTVSPDGGSLRVEYQDPGGEAQELTVDMVVLAAGMVPSGDTGRLAEMLSLDLDAHGFFEEDHTVLRPAATSVEGIYLAGCSSGPRDMQGSVAHAQAAAGEVASRLRAGSKIALQAITAAIDEDLCGGCRACNSLCPYKACSFDREKAVSVVNEVLCRGCGTCVAACPSGAATARHFTDEAIFAEIGALV